MLSAEVTGPAWVRAANVVTTAAKAETSILMVYMSVSARRLSRSRWNILTEPWICRTQSKSRICFFFREEFPIKLVVLPATFRVSEDQAGKGDFSEPCIVSRTSLTVEIC